jgi:hypothetical protein
MRRRGRRGRRDRDDDRSAARRRHPGGDGRHVPVGAMAPRHGGGRRAARLRDGRAGPGRGRVRRVRASRRHHGRLRAGAEPGAPGVGSRGRPGPAGPAGLGRPHRHHRRAHRAGRRPVGVHEQRRRAGAPDAGGAPGRRPPRPAAGTGADAARVRLHPGRDDDLGRHAAQPRRVGIPRADRRWDLFHVRFHPGRTRGGRGGRGLRRAPGLAAGPGPQGARDGGLRSGRLSDRGPGARGQQGGGDVAGRDRGRAGGGRCPGRRPSAQRRPRDRPRAGPDGPGRGHPGHRGRGGGAGERPVVRPWASTWRRPAAGRRAMAARPGATRARTAGVRRERTTTPARRPRTRRC